MILSFRMNKDDLAEAISSVEYEEIVSLFETVDDLQQDSAFTDMVADAFARRKVNR